MSQQFFFYPHILDNLMPPESGFNVYQDMSDKRLRLYVTARGAKTFFTRKRVAGKDVRIIIGNYPKVSIDQARAMLDGTIEKTIAPKKPQKKKILFSRIVSIFMDEKVQRNTLSRQKLKRLFEKFCAGLFSKHLSEISTQDVANLIKDIAKNHGASTANRVRGILKSLFGFAISRRFIDENPTDTVDVLPENHRQNSLTLAGLKKIITKIKREDNSVLRDAFLMVIFGFMKKSEVFSMNWADLDFRRYFYKSHPLTDKAVVLLQNMSQSGKWVFPSGTDHIRDPRASWDKIVNAAGVAGTQMNDCMYLLRKQLKWASDPEVLRVNMNRVLEKLD